MVGIRFSQRLVIGVLLGIGVLGSLPPLVRAEVFLDFYGGLAMTEKTEVKGSGLTTTQKFREDVNFKDSFTVGGRIGYWTKRFPWFGVALDGSYFEAEAKNANIDIPVVGLSFLLMLRYPFFTSEEYPSGRLQPYLGIGPVLAFSKISAEFRENRSEKIKEHATGVGIDLRTGILWHFHQHWGVFTEYRFTHIGFDTNSPFNFYDEYDFDEDLDTTLTTHHFLAGISFRF